MQIMLWYFFMIGRVPAAIECNFTIALTPMTTLSADQESCSARFTYQCILPSLIRYLHTLHCSCRNLESRRVVTWSVSSTRGSCLSDPNAFTSDGQLNNLAFSFLLHSTLFTSLTSPTHPLTHSLTHLTALDSLTSRTHTQRRDISRSSKHAMRYKGRVCPSKDHHRSTEVVP